MISNAVGLLTRIDQGLAQCVGLRKTGDLHVIGLAIEVIGMQGERTGLPVEAKAPVRSSVAVSPRSSTAPEIGSSARSIGTRFVTTLTRPPAAPLPYSRAAGP